MSERLQRPVEPDAQRRDPEVITDIPVVFQMEEKPPLSDTRQVVLAAGATTQPMRYDEEIDGWLVYMLDDVDANKADRVLIANGGATGASDDDILTPGHGVTIMYQGSFLVLENLSANAHTLVVKAFRGWQPLFF
jgi:hypothetical protein